MSDSVFLCDFAFGATVRMALARPGTRPHDSVQYTCPNRAAFDEAALDFLSQQGQPALIGAAISSRGWERKGVLLLPQEGMTIAREDLRDLLGVKRVNLVNNFVARALAVPRLKANEVEKICGDTAMEEQVIAVLGPHHGLGLAALAPDGAGSWTAIPCEGGHSDLPVSTPRESAVCGVLRTHHGHVSREHAISLTGLVNIYQALSAIDGSDISATTPEEVIALASIGDAGAAEAVSLCIGWLAGMASDVALIMGARGGIYLTGDLMDLLADLFDAKAFTQRYLDKGRLSNYVAEIPVYKTLAADLEIIGLATLFD